MTPTDGTVSGSTTTINHGTPATATLTPSAGTSYTSVSIAGYNPLYAVEQQLDLTAPTANYYYNSRGAGEKYLVSGNGSNPTGGGYYILFPNGNLYAFTPDASNDLISTEAATATSVGTAAYAAPALLTGATPGYTPSVYNVEESLELQAPPGASNFFYNSNGAEEKYLYSSTSNTAAGGYYILLPNGNIYAWTGALATTLAAGPVGTVPTLYYQNPNLLISAAAPNGLASVSSTPTSATTSDVIASISDNTLTVTDNGYTGSLLVYITITDGSLTTTQALQVTFTSTAPAQQGGGPAPSEALPLIVTPYLNIPNFGANPTIVSVASGNWSNPATWSLGRVPATGDVVDIAPGTNVTYDVNDSTDSKVLNTVEVEANATLSFATTVSTQMCVVNFMVLQGAR